MKKLLPIIIISFVILISGSVFIVRQTEQAIVLQFGEPVRVITKPGLNFKRPFIFQNVEKFDTRILDVSLDAKEVIASDQKRLIVDAFAKYRITDPLKFYQTVRNEAGIRSRLNAILDSRLREVLGGVPLATLLTQERSKIMHQIKKNVNLQMASFGIEVTDVRIMRADLPKENTQSIFERMKTEREREAKQFRAQGAEEAKIITSKADKERTVILAEAEKKSQILKGEGEAQATKIFADAFNKDPDFFSFYRSMQAYKESLSKDDTTMIITPESDFLKYMKDSKPKN